MVEIQPRFTTLDELLHGRLFRIPSYQRNYSWESKHRSALFGDIRRTWDGGEARSHFMATIVGLRRGRQTILTNSHQVIEIVDGQQRITTLILLLKAIAKAIGELEPEGQRISQELNETLVKPDNASLLLLQTNHDTSHYFADYMRSGEFPRPDSARTLADREILSAMADCEQFVSEWHGDNSSLSELVSLLKNRLTFVLHEIGAEGLVYTVFEVLNSRGLDVSWFDRLKSILMGIVFESGSGNNSEHIEEVHRLWTDIYRCVGLRLGLGAESLRFAATLRNPLPQYKPMSEEKATELLRNQAMDGPDTVIEITKWLKSVTEAVDTLEADHRKAAVTRIIQARLVAAAVYLRHDLTNDEREEVLRRWENVTFRIYGMCRKDARTAVGDYTKLAWSIVQEGLSPNEILSKLSAIGAAFPIDDAVKEMARSDCYDRWQPQLRYFFYRHEEYLAQSTGQNFRNEQWNRIWEASVADSIEHIAPQGSVNDDWTHWLGNLLILPPRLNSKLGMKSPKKKATAYRKTGLLVAGEVVDSLQALGRKRWGRIAVIRRERALLAWASQEWAD